MAKSGGPERIGLRRAIFGLLRAGAVNRSVPETPGNLPLSAALGRAESAARMETGGEGGIRTHGRLAPTSVFETDAIDHSATSPQAVAPYNHTKGGAQPATPLTLGPAPRYTLRPPDTQA